MLEKKGLNNTTIALMVSVALFYDTLQVLLALIFIGWLIIPIAYLTFFVWFRMRGLKFLSLKRAPTLGIGVFLEFISAGIIPSITFSVLRTALDYKIKKIAAVVPGGEMAIGALANKAQVAQTNRSISNQAAQIKQPASVTPLTQRQSPSYSPTSRVIGQKEGTNHTQRMNDPNDVNRRLSDIQTKQLTEKHYAGGMEKYKGDEEKFNTDRMRMEEARAKAQKTRAAYLDEDKNLNKAA